MSDSDLIKAKRIADEIRHIWPEKANEIDIAIENAKSGQRDGIKINVAIKYRVEKFDGEFKPGNKPIDVIEGEG